ESEATEERLGDRGVEGGAVVAAGGVEVELAEARLVAGAPAQHEVTPASRVLIVAEGDAQALDVFEAGGDGAEVVTEDVGGGLHADGGEHGAGEVVDLGGTLHALAAVLAPG